MPQLGFERTALRYVPQRPAWDAILRGRLRELAAESPRWGVPRLYRTLARDGVHANYKRVERLCRLEGLAVLRRARKRLAGPRVPRQEVTQPNDTWAIDFVRDQLPSGRRFRVFTVIDHCTKESPVITVAHSLPSVAVVRALETMITERGTPARLSLDSGTSSAVAPSMRGRRTAASCSASLQPGKPVQNCFSESFKGRVRYERLNAHRFVSLTDAQLHIERWRREYNTERPHESCYPLTPAEHAQTFSPSPTARLLLRSEEPAGRPSGSQSSATGIGGVRPC